MRRTALALARRRHSPIHRRLSSQARPPPPDFDAMDALFTFVPELADDPPALIARSRETLRPMGHGDDCVRLLLPGDTDGGDNDDASLAAALGLLTLRRTAVLQIHNPSARNALSGKMMAELADAVARLEDPRVHGALNAVILAGTGGWFCAGADLRVAQKQLASNDAGTAMSALMVDTLTRFRRLPLVSFAVVEGGAYGGGAELATSCDYRVVEASAIVQFVQARMGVSPGWGGGARLYKLVGRQHALRLLCTATKTSAEDAVALGLADLVFDKQREASEHKILDFVAAFDQVEPGACRSYLCFRCCCWCCSCSVLTDLFDRTRGPTRPEASHHERRRREPRRLGCVRARRVQVALGRTGEHARARVV